MNIKHALAAVSIVTTIAACKQAPRIESTPDAPLAPTAVPAETKPAPAVTETLSPIPPGAVDHLAMTVTAEVEIFGLGKDTLQLKGTVAVHRTGPTGEGGRKMVGDLIAASLRGRSEVFGQVFAIESPIQHSRCEYAYEGPGRYSGHFDINGWFWLPEHNLMLFGSRAVHISGIARGIPPVGQKVEMSATDVQLFDFAKPADHAVGILSRAGGEIHDVVDVESYLRTMETTVPSLARRRSRK